MLRLKPLAMCAIKIWYDYWDTALKEPIGMLQSNYVYVGMSLSC